MYRKEQTNLTRPRPFPYHPIGTAQSHGDLADSEGARLEKLFKSAVGQ